MRSMWSGLLGRNTADKIVALCAGLAVCSAVLLVAALARLDALLPGVLLDDVVCGIRVAPVWPLYAAEAGVTTAILVLLPGRRRSACALAGGWSLLMLAETAADIPAFAADPQLLIEEATFGLIYLYLLGLAIVYAYDGVAPSRGPLSMPRMPRSA